MISDFIFIHLFALSEPVRFEGFSHSFYHARLLFGTLMCSILFFCTCPGAILSILLVDCFSRNSNALCAQVLRPLDDCCVKYSDTF